MSVSNQKTSKVKKRTYSVHNFLKDIKSWAGSVEDECGHPKAEKFKFNFSEGTVEYSGTKFKLSIVET